MSVKLVQNFGAFGAAMAEASYKALDQTAIISQAKIKSLLSKHGAAPSSGSSTPSAPGQPPGLVTGSLRRSIQIDRSLNKGSRPVVRVGTGLVYGRIHELGGPNHPKRPYIVPGARLAIQPAQKAILAIFRNAVKTFRGIA